MSARSEPRRTGVSCEASDKWREYMGVSDGTRLVGKQSRSSHLSTSTRRSFAGKWFAAFGLFHHARTLFRHSSFSPLTDPNKTKSSFLKSPSAVAVVQVPSRFPNRLSIGELASYTTLTYPWDRVYVCLRRSRFRGTVARNAEQFSPPGCLLLTERTRVLTPFREGRSRNSWRVQCGRFPDHPGIGVPSFILYFGPKSLSARPRELGAA